MESSGLEENGFKKRDVEESFVITLSIADIRKLLKQAKKSPELSTRMVVKIPKDIKTIAYDGDKGVRGPVQDSSDEEIK